jgi:UDP:flavonoid glycosyltransferase YjiC (YdhE family)
VSKLLVASHPMSGHVNPMLAVSESLSKGVHDIIFNTFERSREEVEARGLRFAPLLGSANYDHRRLGELLPQLRTAAPGAELTITYRK